MENKIYVTKPSMPGIDEYIQEIKGIWETQVLTNMGDKYKELKEKLIKYLNVNDITLLVNGHLSLELAIQALHLKGEVITTPFTFASTTQAIIRCGLKPVFCDINPVDFTIDVSKIESLINTKTCAILPVHVYGNVCDVEKINILAKKYNLKVIYDAAHTFGVKYKNKGIGSYGDVSMFSFHATKVFNTIEGGAVCYNDQYIGEEINRLRNFGIRNEEVVDCIGLNAKMNEFQAAMGICNLRNIDTEILKRKAIVNRYREKLEKVEGIQLSPIQKGVKSNYAYFPIIINEKVFGYSRNAVQNELKQHNVFTRKYFYPLTNTFHCYNNEYDVSKTPVALNISESVLTLPLYADLPLETVDFICNILINMIGEQR